VLGGEDVGLTPRQVEDLVERGLLPLDTKVVCEGETFATALAARAEFAEVCAAVRRVMAT
jgi:hypothetical protein